MKKTYRIGISWEETVEYRVRASSPEEAEEIAWTRFYRARPVTDGELLWVSDKDGVPVDTGNALLDAPKIY